MTNCIEKLLDRNTKNLTALSLSSLCIVAIIPFAIYRTIAQDWSIAAIDWLIVCSQIFCVYLGYRSESYRLPGIIVAVIFSIGVIASLNIGGLDQLFWLYPATVASYFLTDHVKGSIIASITTVIAAVTCLIPELPLKQAITVLFTLFATNVFGYIFAYMTARRDAELSTLARLDPLTGIGNRRALDDALHAVYNNANPQEEYYLGIFDVDNFKQVNDKFGHLAGDIALTKVSAAITALIDSPANLYRYGGDEFVYLCTASDDIHVPTLFKQLVDALNDQAERLSIDTLTLSLGLAKYHQHESSRQWLNRADKALLQAKHSGKNQFFIAH